MIQIDQIFTYWIFIWYLFYIGEGVPYSPKIAIILAIIHNVINILILLYYKIFLHKGNYKTILLFICIMILIKIIPLYTIRNDKYRVEDVVFLCFLFFVYNLWIKENIFTMQKRIFRSILYNKNETPFMRLIQ